MNHAVRIAELQQYGANAPVAVGLIWVPGNPFASENIARFNNPDAPRPGPGAFWTTVILASVAMPPADGVNCAAA